MMFMAFSVALLTALLCIHAFLTLIDGIGFLPFVIYRLILGVAVLMGDLKSDQAKILRDFDSAEISSETVSHCFLAQLDSPDTACAAG